MGNLANLFRRTQPLQTTVVEICQNRATSAFSSQQACSLSPICSLTVPNSLIWIDAGKVPNLVKLLVYFFLFCKCLVIYFEKALVVWLMVGGWVCVCANDIEPDLNEHHSRNHGEEHHCRNHGEQHHSRNPGGQHHSRNHGGKQYSSSTKQTNKMSASVETIKTTWRTV